MAVFFPSGFSGERPARPPDPNAYTIESPRFDRTPTIDGKLDNAIWRKAAVLEGFTQYEPQEGAVPTEKTIAYIGHDDKNLYIAVRCFDSDPKAIRACLTQRDKVMGDDEVSVYLDTFNDMKQGFVFQVNPCGIQSDGVFVESGGGGGRGGRGGGMMGFTRVDRSWDTYYKASASIDDEGYTIEMAIPFKSLRFPNRASQIWGLQIMRSIRRKSEEIYWYPRSRSINGFLVQTGKIHIEGTIEKGRNLEIMPVATGLQVKGEKFDPEAGFNLKYGITSDLTADATFNPDFSQIEADMPQVDVNQRYALYYPEKRPFFLEGQDFFSTPLELLYTRKLVDPQWGTKFSGKTGKTTLAFMSVYDKNPVDIEFPGAEPPTDEEEEILGGRALFTAFRLKRDLFPESYIGFIMTDKEMGYDGEALTANYNRVAGVDGHFKFARLYRFSFQLVGAKSRLNDVETKFVPALSLSLSRQARHLQLSTAWTSIHPDFEAAAGFFRRKDIHSFRSRVSYAILPENQYIISMRPSLQYRRIHDFNRDLTDEEIELSFFVSGWRQSNVWVNYQDSFEKYNGVGFELKEWRFNVMSEPLSWLSGRISRSFGDGIYYSDDPFRGYKTSWSGNLTLKPFAPLRLFYTYSNNRFFERKGGEQVYSINIISQRIGYQISKPLSLRLITDWNDYDKKLYLSFLVSYELNPGTVFYIGIDDNQEKDEAGIFRNTGRYYFIKFSYWWRF